jgi:hypothetical protein
MLQMLELLCNHHKLRMLPDPELEQLKAATEPAELLRELRTNCPKTASSAAAGFSISLTAPFFPPSHQVLNTRGGEILLTEGLSVLCLD